MNLTAEHWFFYPFALFAIISAIGVIRARNPLYSALFLVCCFFFLAGIYVLMAAHLVAALQIIVYTGAIMVLFLFVIMLLALSEEDLGSRKITVFKVVGGLATVSLVWYAAKAFGLQRGAGSAELAGQDVPRLIMWIRQLDRSVLPEDFGTVAAVGKVLYTEHILQFEAVSLLLLVAIAGAVVVAKSRI